MVRDLAQQIELFMLRMNHIENLCGFGKMRAGDGDFPKNIDS